MKKTKCNVVKSYLIFTIIAVILGMAFTSLAFFPSLNTENVVKALIPIRTVLNIVDFAYLVFSIFLLCYVIKRKLEKIYLFLPLLELIETGALIVLTIFAAFLKWNLTKISSLLLIEGYVTGFIALGLSLYLLFTKK